MLSNSYELFLKKVLLISLAYLVSGFISISIADHSDLDYLFERSYNLPNLGENLQVAEADSDAEQDEGEMSEKCREFAKDDRANVGAVMAAGCEPTLAQMAALMDNPLGNVAMLFTQFDYTRLRNGDNKKTGKQGLYTGIAQFPLSVSEEWNIINRVIWTVPSLPIDQDKIDRFGNGVASGGIPPGGGPFTPPDKPIAPIDLFDGRTTAFGDMYYVGLFSPKEGISHENGATSVWGVGFDIAFPTAQEDIVGSGKYSAGPSALYAYLSPTWKVGGLGMHYWDFASRDGRRDDVNLTNIQTLYYYSINPTTSIGAAPNVIMNWEEDSDNFLTLPIGTGINTTVNFGKLPVRFGFEVHYAVVRPDDTIGSDWNLRFYAIPAVPSGLIPFLN